MKQSVLVVGHADADGHLIAEQTRRNLSLIESFDVKTVVDPARTKDHKAWFSLDKISEINDADIVFFVDMMFAPTTCVEEAKALVDFVNDRPEKRFYLVDHHPLPTRRLDAADNLRVVYRPDVFECAIGPRSGMMVVAALCEGQAAKVADIKRPVHDTLALAMRRAAALGGTLPGEKLLSLLRCDCWQGLFELGTDPRELHRLPRGRRPANQPQSKALLALEETASALLVGGHSCAPQQGGSMSYDDVHISQERFVTDAASGARSARAGNRKNEAVDKHDAETIVTILELAAISLTTRPGQTFTRAQLVEEARDIGGDEIILDDEDVDIILTKQGFLKRVGRELILR